MRRRPRTWSIALAASLVSLGALSAQGKTPPTEAGRTRAPAAAADWIELERYDPKSSRKSFAACDANRDDRLDVREAIRALPNMGTLEAPVGFRLLDSNRDGFVHWDEFDGRYQNMVKDGGKFLFRPARPLVLDKSSKNPTPADKTQAAIGVILTMHAEDDDPEMSKTEFAKLLVTLKQPGNLGATFPLLDADQSGGLSTQELEPVVARFPHLLELAENAPRTGARPEVSRTDMAGRLRRLHPTLGRWSTQIFRAADRDGDGKLSNEEIDPSAK